MKALKITLFICCMTALAVTAWGQVSVGNIAPGKVGVATFTLQQPETIRIKGTGGTFYDDWRLLIYYGWIVETETRKVVWHGYEKMDREDAGSGEFDLRDEVALAKGTYELYFTGAFHQQNGWSDASFSSLVDYVFGERGKVKFKRSTQELMGIELSGQSLKRLKTLEVMAAKTAGAVVSIQKPGPNANIKKGFTLTAETTLRIYAIGEGTRDEIYDYAWIDDLDHHKRVWEMDYHNTDFAGGGKKNLKVEEKIKLPAGNYRVSYVTDDSHGYNDWNVMPPDDPQFSGITLWADTDKDRKNVAPFRMPEEAAPVLQITKVGDDDFKSQGLSLQLALDLRILCIGEQGSDDEMVDNGWIVNAATREVVWDMNQAWKKHAGGAQKNRMFEGTVHLDKGEYIVYYATDDSHSYSHWNSKPPHEQDHWGITVWVSKKNDLSRVSVFDPEKRKTGNAIVEIVRVRDDAYLNETFTLDSDTKLRIVAIGEGDDGSMVDYGWIKNVDTGKVVWEMTYRNTENAGGASKNRLYDDTIILPKGSYKIFYETDGSHAYRSWNASPPRDQEKYGISLYAEKN